MAKKVVPLKSNKKKDEAITCEEIKLAQEIIDSMPPDVLAEFRKLAENCDTEEDLIKDIFVGDCPVCGSGNVHDCDETPFGDITIGQCTDCGVLWCLECETIFAQGQTACDHWDVCETCEFCDDDGFCETPITDCNKIKKWKKGAGDKAVKPKAHKK